MKKVLAWIKGHKKASAIIFVALLIIGLATNPNKTPTTTSTKASTASTSTKASTTSTPKSTATAPSKATFEAVLLNPANDNNTPSTLPAAGWDANDGWDTATQADTDSNSTTAIQPAVIVKDAKTLEVYVNVKNTGSSAGTAVCKIDASSVEGSNPAAGNYFGTKSRTFTAPNGGDIKPGNYSEGIVDLTITNQGARYIKQVTVTC